VETDATRMCELLVGLPDVNVLGVEEWSKPLIPECGLWSCSGAVVVSVGLVRGAKPERQVCPTVIIPGFDPVE
jgi:hypothetical protein